MPLNSKDNPKSVEQQLNDIANEAAKYYLSKRTDEYFMTPFFFLNPYSGQENVIKVKMKSEGDNESVAGYTHKDKLLEVYPHNVTEEYVKLMHNINSTYIDSYKKAVKLFIIHELTHVIDPKFEKDNPFKGREKTKKLNNLRMKIPREEWMHKYYADYSEFDAHCREIIETLRYLISVDHKVEDELKLWLLSKNKTIPYYLVFAAPALNRWFNIDKNIDNNFKYIRLFKMRAYNELFKNLHPMPESQYSIKRKEKIQNQQKQQQLNNPQRKAYRMSWFTKISRRPWSEIPFTDREVRPNTNPYSTKNEDYPEKSNITTIDSPGMGTNQHNNSEVSGDGESDSQVKDLTSFTDIDSIMYEGQVMDEDTGGKPRPRTTDTGGPYIGDQPMVLGLPDDAAGSFVVNYSPNEKTPQEVATDNFLNFQNRPSRKVQLNGRSVNIV